MSHGLSTTGTKILDAINEAADIQQTAAGAGVALTVAAITRVIARPVVDHLLLSPMSWPTTAPGDRPCLAPPRRGPWRSTGTSHASPVEQVTTGSPAGVRDQCDGLGQGWRQALLYSSLTSSARVIQSPRTVNTSMQPRGGHRPPRGHEYSGRPE
ncbi:hypothetical protein AB0I84_35575 [Streptomyces spectabilis]|uniref:hypothetical protein n=1 Tax=Streptomyces spectabilis TaxID=68270 RepID=UPI00340A9714